MNRKAIKNSKNRTSLEFFKPRIELYSHYLRNIQKPRIFCSIRAITEATLALLIIAIITMGFLAIFVYNYGERQTCTQKVELCRTSMTLLNTIRWTGFAGEVFQLPESKIDCPICVPGSSDKIKTEKQEEAIHEVAEHLRWCWYKTLGGNNIMGYRWAYALNKKLCLVCSEFTTNTEIKPTELMNYLQTTKIRIGPGAGKTYLQYLDTTLRTESILEPQIIIESPHVVKTRSQIPKELLQILEKEETPKMNSILQNKFYQLIHYHFGWKRETSTPFNQLFLVPSEKVPQLPCDVYHYQKE